MNPAPSERKSGMKIVIATPLYPPVSGGPATYARVLEQELPKLGIEVTLVKFSDVRKRWFRHLRYFRLVSKAARGADLVYALDAVSVGFPAMLAAKRRGKRFVVKVAGDFAWEQGSQRALTVGSLEQFVRRRSIPLSLWPLRFLQTLVARSARRVVVPSNYLEGVVAEWGVSREHISVIWNAVSVEMPTKVPSQVGALPRPIVVSVGRLVPWKGFFTCIEAVKILRAEGIAASLAVVGDGPDRQDLEAEAKRSLGSGFAFCGALSQGDTHATIRYSEVFVLDSSYEGLSHTLIEAVSLGASIVASDIPANREVVEHERSALLVPPNDAMALAAAIQRLLSDSELTGRLAENGRSIAAAFSIPRMVLQTATLLQSV